MRRRLIRASQGSRAHRSALARINAPLSMSVRQNGTRTAKRAVAPKDNIGLAARCERLRRRGASDAVLKRRRVGKAECRASAPVGQLRNGRIWTMKIGQCRWLGLLACAAAVTAACVPAAAQIQQSAARDAAIHRCIEQAQQMYPGTSQGTNRSDSYKACMTNAGFTP